MRKTNWRHQNQTCTTNLLSENCFNIGRNMWHWNTKADWNSERRLPKAKENINKKEHFVRSNKNSDKILLISAMNDGQVNHEYGSNPKQQKYDFTKTCCEYNGWYLWAKTKIQGIEKQKVGMLRTRIRQLKFIVYIPRTNRIQDRQSQSDIPCQQVSVNGD